MNSRPAWDALISEFYRDLFDARLLETRTNDGKRSVLARVTGNVFRSKRDPNAGPPLVTTQITRSFVSRSGSEISSRANFHCGEIFFMAFCAIMASEIQRKDSLDVPFLSLTFFLIWEFLCLGTEEVAVS